MLVVDTEGAIGAHVAASDCPRRKPDDNRRSTLSGSNCNPSAGRAASEHILRSGAGGEVEGAVSLGMSSTLAATLAGRFIEFRKEALPKVTLKFAVADSQSIKARVEAHTLDMVVVFEDELVPIFARKPMFRQRLYLVSNKPLFKKAATRLEFAPYCSNQSGPAVYKMRISY